MGPLASLLRVIRQGDGDLLSLIPANAYRMDMGELGWSRRTILVVNAPELVRHVLTDPDGVFPKNDLMTGALAPLVGDSMFVSSGPTWRRQRRMIDPAFSHMRLAPAFADMSAAVDGFEARAGDAAAAGGTMDLDLEMGALTADIICRTVFSAPLANAAARDVFESFALFERRVAHVEVMRLIFGRPFDAIPQSPDVLEACARIRARIADLLAPHLAGQAGLDDIASALAAARDPESGAAFTREELIDQLAVFFLAGHETTASGLTWAIWIAAARPEISARIRDEVDAVCGEGPVGFEQARALSYTRSVFKEAVRLYPPITFIPRVAAADTRIGARRVRRGTMVMIAPWVIHRHETLWEAPDVFDPDRFSPAREGSITPGAYLPFGLGPRVCVGAAFATLEATLILARLFRRHDVAVHDIDAIRPVARLTTRPAEPVRISLRPRGAP